MQETVNVAFIGNPNCGKTTLFNAYTGAKLKVANWPGVTVEKKEGIMKYHDAKYKLCDLPGIYSLTSYTMEETVSRNYILSDDVDIIVDVVDASALERNLFLALGLIELGKPVVIALNMMDIIEERGMEIDLHRLPEMLGVPVIPVSARKRTGLSTLMHAVAHHVTEKSDKPVHHHSEGSHVHKHHDELAMVYSDDIEDKIDALSTLLQEKYKNLGNYRWYAIKTLEGDKDILENYPVDIKFDDKNYEDEIINQKYEFIEEIISETLVNKDEKARKTDKADKALTHPVWGIPIFLVIMAAVFFLTFTVGDFIKGYFEKGLDILSGALPPALEKMGAGPMLVSLIVDGILAGVGGILTFLPNIFILFLALAFLEDSGYMSRIAYVMDNVMGKIGLSGRAFIPMILGFGCSVPAVMASRALEDRRDRIKTILVTPFMSCSARLPIYIMFSEMFFEKYAMLVAYSMYIIGVIAAILIALIMSKIDKKRAEHSLLIELPEYKMPNIHTVFIYVWEKVKDYLTKAGTTIFIASIILWFLLNFGFGGLTDNMGDSFAGVLGKNLVPILKPAGLGFWQIAVALIAGVAAKEVVVSSTGVLFGVANAASAAGRAAIFASFQGIGFGAVNAMSLMLFCLLYIPCVATIATIRREAGRKWAWASALLHLSTAWLVSTLFYTIASLL
ncbi:MAG: ferrous iron transport protein B [Clostridia bacterium]|nr:ferrous iron transport protein B [Clostridia bacterium]